MNWLSSPYRKYYHDIITCNFRTRRYRKMTISKADFPNTTTNVLYLSVNQREMLSDDRYDTISTIIHWKYDEIREWSTTKSKLKTTRGRASYGCRKVKGLQALAWWSTNLTLRGKNIILADFDGTITEECIYEAKLNYEDGKKDPNIKKSDKFSHSKCVVW